MVSWASLMDGWSCYWIVLFIFWVLLFSIWNGERRADREQGGLEGLTGVDVPVVLASSTATAWSRGLSPQAPGGHLVGRCRLVRGELLGGVLACALEFSGFC
jgi:hypothetical protein